MQNHNFKGLSTTGLAPKDRLWHINLTRSQTIHNAFHVLMSLYVINLTSLWSATVGRTAYVIILNKILIKVHCIIHVLHVILHSVLYNIASPLSFSLFVLWICPSFGFHFPSPCLVLFRHNYLVNRSIMNILYGCRWKCFLCRNPVFWLVLNRDAWYLSDW